MKLHRINDLQAHHIRQAVRRIVETVEALDLMISVTECENNRTPHEVMVTEVASTINKANEYLRLGLYYDDGAFVTCMESLNYWLTKINHAILWSDKQDVADLTAKRSAYLLKYGWTKEAPVNDADFYSDTTTHKPS